MINRVLAALECEYGDSRIRNLGLALPRLLSDIVWRLTTPPCTLMNNLVLAIMVTKA